CWLGILQRHRNPPELWRIRTNRQFDANRRIVQAGVMVLFQPSAYLAGLDPNYGIFSRRVTGRALKKLRPDRSLLQWLVVVFQPMVNHIRQKLLTPITGPKELTIKDGIQLAK